MLKCALNTLLVFHLSAVFFLKCVELPHTSLRLIFAEDWGSSFECWKNSTSDGRRSGLLEFRHWEPDYPNHFT